MSDTSDNAQNALFAEFIKAYNEHKTKLIRETSYWIGMDSYRLQLEEHKSKYYLFEVGPSLSARCEGIFDTENEALSVFWRIESWRLND